MGIEHGSVPVIPPRGSLQYMQHDAMREILASTTSAGYSERRPFRVPKGAYLHSEVHD